MCATSHSYNRILQVHLAQLSLNLYLVAEEDSKISRWHARCVQYIISTVTYWITHLMLWMCQYYEVLSSDLTGSMSVDKPWPMPARPVHTHTQTHTPYTHTHCLFPAIVLTKWFTHVQFVQRCIRAWKSIRLHSSLCCVGLRLPCSVDKGRLPSYL